MCKWSKVLFVEFPEQIEVFRDILGSFEEYKVISLTPHASLSLELSGIPYSIIADYFNEKDIEEFGIHTTAQVNSMISLIDDFLQANIPEFTDTQFRPAWFAGYFLKKLYDSVALRSYELNHVLKALGPVELLYSKPVTDDFEDNLNWKELSLYSHVFRLISAQSDLKSVELEFDYTSVSSTNPLTYQAQEHETRVGGPAGNPLIDRLRHIAKQNPYAVKYYRWLRQQYQGMATGVRWLTPRAHSLGKEPDTVPRTYPEHHLLPPPEGRGIMLQPSDCGVLENFGIASQIPVILDLQRTIDSRIWNGRAEVWSWDGAEGIPSHSAGTSLSDEYDPAEGGPQPELSVALESAWKILSNGARYQELFQFGSWNWHPIVETRMRYLCTELTAKLWQKRNQSQRILGSIRPHVVLFRNPNTLSIKVVAHTARRMGIRIVGTQHGESGIRRGPVTVQYQEYAFCDDFLVYGEGTVNFSDRYYPGKVNTIIVGSPQLDSCRKNQMGKEELCRRLGFSGNKKLVIVCFTDLYGNSRVSRNTMPSDCSSFRSLRRIVDVFPQHPDVQFIIKAHPGRRAPASPFYAYADHLKAQNVVVRSQVPLSKILTAADMFIVNCPSTALLQMSLYDSPIYIFEDWAQWDEEALDIIKTRCYVDDDIGHFCERLDADLRSGAAFQRVLTDRSLRHTYADPFEDGLSAERVKEAVMNIALQSSLLEEL